MIKEDFEDKQNFIFNEEYTFNFFIDYIYLFLSQKLKNLKKLSFMRNYRIE
jgi:hypothetical protein